jgi:hypothetical protein
MKNAADGHTVFAKQLTESLSDIIRLDAVVNMSDMVKRLGWCAQRPGDVKLARF